MADQVPTLQAFGEQGQSPFAQPNQTNLLGQANTALQNPLLQQYLSALGGSMGGTVAKGLDKVNQQNISAQNYMKMLQKMMSGGAKVGMDSEKTTINMPTKDAQTIMSGGVQGDETAGQAGGFGNDRSMAGGGTTATPQPINPMAQVLGGNINPSASPLGNFSGSDLAGLTPQDISSALTGKLASDRIGQESINSVFDNMYKVAQVDRLMSPEEKSTSDIKNYQYAVRNGGFKGTFEDWSKREDSSIEQYKFAVSRGYDKSYPEWKLELARASATNINTNEKKLDYQVKEARQSGMVAMDEGKEVIKAMDKAVDDNSDFERRNFAIKNSKDPVKMKQYRENRRMAKAGAIQDFIGAGNGESTWSVDKKTGIATVIVKWPNKEERTYTYNLDK